MVQREYLLVLNYHTSDSPIMEVMEIPCSAGRLENLRLKCNIPYRDGAHMLSYGLTTSKLINQNTYKRRAI